jgi:hypothetical protein
VVVAFWLLALAQLVVLLGSHELGHLIGRRMAGSQNQERRARSQNWEAEVVGLLGLLTAFSFGMAVARFDARRQLILEESNAIGTTYLRTQFLPDPAGPELRQLLRSYVDVRLEYHRAAADRARVLAAVQQSSKLQAQIWSRVVRGASADPRATTTALLVQSTNEMIDLEAKRRAALFNHVPWTVYLMIGLVAATAVGVMGYAGGLTGRRWSFAAFAMPMLISAVITLIFNIDHPRVGIVRLGQQSMIDLKDSM